jgi:hypothetical protein
MATHDHPQEKIHMDMRRLQVQQLQVLITARSRMLRRLALPLSAH